MSCYIAHERNLISRFMFVTVYDMQLPNVAVRMKKRNL